MMFGMPPDVARRKFRSRVLVDWIFDGFTSIRMACPAVIIFRIMTPPLAPSRSV
jgi:hypothetical protein